MNQNPGHLLEQYIIGKDQDKHKILETIYEESAEVEFENNSTNITFPNKIIGHKNIAKTLSADFNKTYENVKTYYLARINAEELTALEQPWLVVMKEIGSEVTRVGSGYYSWDFIKTNNELKIFKHKIYIHSMLEIHDPQSELLLKIQEQLEYPWVDKKTAICTIKNYENLTEITKYLMT